jgi:cell division protein FtsN
MLGFEAKISQRETDAGTIHRVRIGPVPDLEMTNRARSKLAENGVESSIIKIK